MIIPFKGIKPEIDSTAFIVKSSQIIGDIKIGKLSSIWFNAVVRGDVNYIRIGNRTNIQDGSVLHVTHKTHPLILDDNITVGHGVILHGCHIKSRCLIGMGAVIMDGVVIEEDVIIGAGSVVTPNSIIPKKSLAIGIPAKPKRNLTEQELKQIQDSASNYIEYCNEYINTSPLVAEQQQGRVGESIIL